MTQTKFTQELFDAICDRIADGESLRAICADDPSMPNVGTVLRWIGGNEELRKQYAHARDCQADAIADETIHIADTEPDPARARVRIDARKWMAGKMRPKVYGDKVDHTSSDGSMTPTPTIIQLIPVEPDIDDSAG